MPLQGSYHQLYLFWFSAPELASADYRNSACVAVNHAQSLRFSVLAHAEAQLAQTPVSEFRSFHFPSPELRVVSKGQFIQAGLP